jgi:Protein of unknwon function (DUF3310)
MGRKALTRAEKIRRFLTANPTMPLKDVAIKFDTTYNIVYMAKKRMQEKKTTVSASEVIAAQKAGISVEEFAKTKIKAKRERKPENINTMIAEAQEARKEMAIEMIEPKSDPVNHPAHYKAGGIETIDFIEAKGLNYRLGNVVKYITRADHKGNRKQDLEKAMWYLKREIETNQGA